MHYIIFYTSAIILDWNYDWKAGKKPKTPAEREAAAKKYGLRPEDYEVYGEDEYEPAGDYPKLPLL